MELIVTGFDAFDKASTNPSQSIVELLPKGIAIPRQVGLDQGIIPITTSILKTCCEDSWQDLYRLLEEKSNSNIALIMLGLAESRSNIEMERVALNLRDYRIPDNNGHKHEATSIILEEENALFNPIDLAKIKAKLEELDLYTDISNHAGTFVCNEIYFRALSYQKKNPHLKAVLFVHVPGLWDNQSLLIEEPDKLDESIDLQKESQPAMPTSEAETEKLPALKYISLVVTEIAKELIRQSQANRANST